VQLAKTTSVIRAATTIDTLKAGLLGFGDTGHHYPG
jgi:hypothetical protein